jgi:hypothetical protein
MRTPHEELPSNRKSLPAYRVKAMGHKAIQANRGSMSLGF